MRAVCFFVRMIMCMYMWGGDASSLSPSAPKASAASSSKSMAAVTAWSDDTT